MLEAAGISDILTKSLGSANPLSMVWATIRGLRELRTPELVAAERGVEVGSLGYRPRQQEEQQDGE